MGVLLTEVRTLSTYFVCRATIGFLCLSKSTICRGTYSIHPRPFYLFLSFSNTGLDVDLLRPGTPQKLKIQEDRDASGPDAFSSDCFITHHMLTVFLSGTFWVHSLSVLQHNKSTLCFKFWVSHLKLFTSVNHTLSEARPYNSSLDDGLFILNHNSYHLGLHGLSFFNVCFCLM